MKLLTDSPYTLASLITIDIKLVLYGLLPNLATPEQSTRVETSLHDCDSRRWTKNNAVLGKGAGPWACRRSRSTTTTRAHEDKGTAQPGRPLLGWNLPHVPGHFHDVTRSSISYLGSAAINFNFPVVHATSIYSIWLREVTPVRNRSLTGEGVN
jgi:hypothetical protein